MTTRSIRQLGALVALLGLGFTIGYTRIARAPAHVSERERVIRTILAGPVVHSEGFSETLKSDLRAIESRKPKTPAIIAGLRVAALVAVIWSLAAEPCLWMVLAGTIVFPLCVITPEDLNSPIRILGDAGIGAGCAAAVWSVASNFVRAKAD